MRRYVTGATLLLLGLLMLTPAFGQDDEVMQLLKAGSDKIQSGHYQEAIEPLQKAINKKPDASKEMAGHYLLALAYTGLNKYQEAVESYKEAIKLNPNFTNAYIGLGKAYFSLEL